MGIENLLEILQLLQRHRNGLDEVERKVHILQLGQLPHVLKKLGSGWRIQWYMESRRFVIGRISKFWHILWSHLRDSVQLVLCHGESFQHFERSDVFRQHLDLVPRQVKISQVPNNLELTWLDLLLENHCEWLDHLCQLRWEFFQLLVRKGEGTWSIDQWQIEELCQNHKEFCCHPSFPQSRCASWGCPPGSPSCPGGIVDQSSCFLQR